MFTRRAFLGSTLAVAASPAMAWNSTAGSRDFKANVSSYLDPFVARRDFSGFVLLERGGKTLVSRGFGFADWDRRVPNTEHTGFMTASIGKMFTRAAVLELERGGRLSTADKLGRFLPQFPDAGTITLQHLIDHESGVARDLPPGTDLSRERSLDELVAVISSQPAVGKPGQSSGYSNNGYRLLAKVIEVAGRGSYDELVRELVFEPRGMTGSASGVDPAKLKRAALGYRPGPGWGTIMPEPRVALSNERGAGSFYVTAADLMRFLRTLPLQPKDLETASRVDPQGKPKPRSVGHDGFGSGFANLAYAYPDEEARMVLLGNIQSGLFNPLHADLRKLLFGEAVTPPALPRPGDVDAGDLTRYVGDYDLRPGAPLMIRKAAYGISADAGEGAHPLIPLGQGRFFMRLRYATMTFDGEPGKPAALLRWAEGGGEFPLKRIA